jgi:SAM-dependent methyltransferase
MNRITFDGQAGEFAARAGLPGTAAAQVANALCELTGAGANDVVLDLGAGTGEVSRAIARLAPTLGLDLSLPMLREQCAYRKDSRPWLVAGDANRGWPIGSGTVSVIFASRAAHLLVRETLVEESLRVARPARAFLVLGGIRRAPDSLQSRLRAQLFALLGHEQVHGRDQEEAIADLKRAFAERGAELLPLHVAARLRAEHSPARALADWRGKPGLAGIDIAPAVKQRVLDALETWAARTFGSLETTVGSDESFVLEGARLPSRTR